MSAIEGRRPARRDRTSTPSVSMTDSRRGRLEPRNRSPRPSRSRGDERRLAAGGKRSRADEVDARTSDQDRIPKRARNDSSMSSTNADATAADCGHDHTAPCQQLLPTLRNLKSLLVQAELDRASAMDKLAQMKQVLFDVTAQLVDAKADQFHGGMTREDAVEMLQNGMPAWIARELFPLHQNVQSSADRPREPDATQTREPTPTSAPKVTDATIQYFLEGPGGDEHIGNYTAPRTSSSEDHALCNDDVRGVLPGVDYRISLNVILWQATDKYRLPAPVGRFGHPFCKGWLWEDFDAKRLFDRARSDYTSANSPDFRRLALEAIRIPFACRSAAQRQVVSVALKDRIIPVDGAPAEPNVLQFCKQNPALLPYAIRRQFTCDHARGIVYSEWDAVDLGVYIALKMAAPAKAASTDVQRHQLAQWLTALQYTMYWAGSEDASWWTTTVLDEYADGPRPYEGSLGDYNAIFTHLQRCGLYYESLLEGPQGYVYAYVQRMANCDERKKRLGEEYERSLPPGQRSNQRDARDYVSRNMLYERIHEGSAVVRIKLTSEKVQRLLDQPEKIVQYAIY